ncbi:unnamed protein product [Mytilus coruscus]|uniref:Fibronectin type-III domain-containing protein n=1 Tax=Mytilus coruscus TaxID=42192 RepID=A0A6J8B1K0_MYTCO|nr:unnamed protein product [Mytilus coruscus]
MEPQSQITKITASNTTIRLEFEVPCDSVEAPIMYDISYTSLDHSCTGDQTNVTSWLECFPLRPCEITGLFSYWDYFIKVQESSENNVGVWSNEYKVTTFHSVYNQTRCSVYGLEEYWQYEVTIIAHTVRGNKQYKHPRYIRTKQSGTNHI